MGLGLLVSLTLVGLAGVHGDIVQTQYGPVNGHTVPVDNGRTVSDVEAFYAIPYAHSTAGVNRFQLPKAPLPWTEVFEADTLGPACPQNEGSWVNTTHPGWAEYSEDCLHLNIFTPSDQAGGPYPVLVWIYGGSYQSGANIQYPGHILATYGLVVVVMNYRLGAFGFGYTTDGVFPGNMGLWDQNMALQFVQDNIAAFGGDPNKVTIFGQSAGSSSVSLQVVSQASRGLTQQAIMESGTEFMLWAVNLPPQHPENYIAEVAADLGCPFLFNEAMLSCMRNQTWEDIVATRSKCTPGFLCLGMAPVVDGPGGFLPRDPREMRADGDFAKIPIITGINRDDGALWTPDVVPGSEYRGFTQDQFQRYIKNRLLLIWDPLLSNQTSEDVFEAINYNYAPWPYVDDEYENRHQFNEIMTDAAFGSGWDEQAKNQSAANTTYTYIFDFRGRNNTQKWPEWMGVPHEGELPYVWGYPLLPQNPAVLADTLIYADIVDWTDEDRAYSMFWNELYANFAKYGNPTPTPVDAPNDLGPVTWPPYTFEAMNSLYVHNTSVEVVQEWRQQDYAFWQSYMDYLVGDAPIPFFKKDQHGQYLGQPKRNSAVVDDILDHIRDTTY